MRYDGTMRQAIPGSDGRGDLEIWSVLASEWLHGPDPDKAAIDALIASFFGAFTNAAGAEADVDVVYRLFVAGALIVKGGADQQVYDLAGFVEPRRTLLRSGELTGFVERETWERTEIFGDIAQRSSRYHKAGILDGKRFEGRGRKSFQLLRTADGWRLTALSWSDEPA
jgi:hypothetical protein